MNVIFEPSIQPNFIKTNVGRIDLRDLSKEDLDELKIVQCNALEDNWRRRKHGRDALEKEGEQ